LQKFTPVLFRWYLWSSRSPAFKVLIPWFESVARTIDVRIVFD